MYHVGICLYLVIMCMHVLQTHVCGLTDDGVGSHFLANHCSIAAQEHWKWGHVSACVPLADFVHFTAIDCPILGRLGVSATLFRVAFSHALLRFNCAFVL